MPADEKPNDLELQKLSLEERKFDFEVKKYTDESLLRDLEREKTTEELRELKKPWWRKAAYLSLLTTIMVAVVGGIQTS